MKIRTLWSHCAKSLSFLHVYLKGWPSALLSLMSPCAARAASLAAILAVSAHSCSAVWAFAAASVTWACYRINTALEVIVSSVLLLAPMSAHS